MIPRANITAWRASAPWPTDAQVEQDLVLSRAIVSIFGARAVAEQVAFRGGTALHKLILDRPRRYSEDIDLVQRDPGPIGPTFDAIRELLQPWLGRPSRKQGPGRATMIFRFDTTMRPVHAVRLKVEINTREHFTVLGYQRRKLVVENRWFTGGSDVVTYKTEELLATKLRALYQRRKGRDLYDLALALTTLDVEDVTIVECFRRYMAHGDTPVSRAEFEANLRRKLSSADFMADVTPMLADDAPYDPASAGEIVHARLVSRLPGEPWKGGAS